MSDAFDAPIRVEGAVVAIDGAVGVVTVTPPTLFGPGGLAVDGAPASSTGRNRFEIPTSEGPCAVTLVPSFSRTLPSVKVDGTGHVYEMGEAVPIPLLVFAFAPIVLVPIGGCLGGAFGGAAVAGNLAIARQPWAAPVKAAAMLACGVSAVGVYAVLGTILALAAV